MPPPTLPMLRPIERPPPPPEKPRLIDEPKYDRTDGADEPREKPEDGAEYVRGAEDVLGAE